MHTVEVLDQAIAAAKNAGFQVRQDWFGGAPAGACELKGKRWLFIDLSLSLAEQLEQVLDALAGSPELPDLQASPQLHSLLSLRRAA